MESLSIPLEKTQGLLSQSRAHVRAIRGWLKNHETSAFFITQFPIYLAAGAIAGLMTPIRWRLIGVLASMVASIAIGELFEDAAPQTKVRFLDVVRDRTS